MNNFAVQTVYAHHGIEIQRTNSNSQDARANGYLSHFSCARLYFLVSQSLVFLNRIQLLVNVFHSPDNFASAVDEATRKQ